MAEGIEANDKIPAIKDPSVRKRLTPRVTRPRKKQKQNDIYDDPEAVLGDIGSPLFKDGVNIKNIILHPKAVAILGDIGSACQKVDSDILSTAIADFKEDGEWGHFDPVWVKEAMAAHNFRASGSTVAYEEHLFNEMWRCERETLSDDEDTYQPHHHGDHDGHINCGSTIANNITKSDDIDTSANCPARSSDELQNSTSQNRRDGLCNETVATDHTTGAQNKLDILTSPPPGPQINT